MQSCKTKRANVSGLRLSSATMDEARIEICVSKCTSYGRRGRLGLPTIVLAIVLAMPVRSLGLRDRWRDMLIWWHRLV